MYHVARRELERKIKDFFLRSKRTALELRTSPAVLLSKALV
jgi:hypothetical protein